MNTVLKQQIIDLALSNPTEEICGYIYATHDSTAIHPCRNIAADRTKCFQIGVQDQLACIKQGTPIGVYHSHPLGPDGFSEGDLESAERATLPFYLCDLANHVWTDYVPTSYHAPLEGRPFRWGFDDCYGTARLYFRQICGLHLRDYDRDDRFEQQESNAIFEHFADEGFVRLEPDTAKIQPHDALLFHINTRNPQHLGVFQGKQQFLHHPQDKLSNTQQLDGRWLGHLEHILRHKSLVKTEAKTV